MWNEGQLAGILILVCARDGQIGVAAAVHTSVVTVFDEDVFAGD